MSVSLQPTHCVISLHPPPPCCCHLLSHLTAPSSPLLLLSRHSQSQDHPTYEGLICALVLFKYLPKSVITISPAYYSFQVWGVWGVWEALRC